MTPSMKHYLITLTYLVPLERLNETTPAHRAFLQEGYDAGLLLMSGPQEPRIGGIIMARCPSLAELQTFLQRDPFQIEKLVSYTYTEFHPVKRQPFLESWVTGA